VVSTPSTEAIFNEANQNVFTNWPNAYATFKKLKPILLGNAYMIPRPTPYVSSMWWPWVKNYYGAMADAMVRYAWVDQNLKKTMGH
jgi:hypothetical protein